MPLSSLELAFDVLAFLFAISVHEAAHAWSADRLGDPTARLLGRVTLNPWPHIDFVGTILMPLFGILSHLPILGWAKPTPVNVSRLRHPRRDDLLVSAAGPLSNLLVALLAVTALFLIRAFSTEGARVVGHLADYRHLGDLHGSLVTPLALLLYRFLFINVLLGVFNLIPIPPLDGSHILGNALPLRLQRVYAEVGRFGFLILLGLLWLGVPYLLFSPVFEVFNSILRA